jgi:hypothetical protein
MALSLSLLAHSKRCALAFTESHTDSDGDGAADELLFFARSNGTLEPGACTPCVARVVKWATAVEIAVAGGSGVLQQRLTAGASAACVVEGDLLVVSLVTGQLACIAVTVGDSVDVRCSIVPIAFPLAASRMAAYGVRAHADSLVLLGTPAPGGPAPVAVEVSVAALRAAVDTSVAIDAPVARLPTQQW